MSYEKISTLIGNLLSSETTPREINLIRNEINQILTKYKNNRFTKEIERWNIYVNQRIEFSERGLSVPGNHEDVMSIMEVVRSLDEDNKNE